MPLNNIKLITFVHNFYDDILEEKDIRAVTGWIRFFAGSGPDCAWSGQDLFLLDPDLYCSQCSIPDLANFMPDPKPCHYVTERFI